MAEWVLLRRFLCRTHVVNIIPTVLVTGVILQPLDHLFSFLYAFEHVADDAVFQCSAWKQWFGKPLSLLDFILFGAEVQFCRWCQVHDVVAFIVIADLSLHRGVDSIFEAMQRTDAWLSVTLLHVLVYRFHMLVDSYLTMNKTPTNISKRNFIR